MKNRIAELRKARRISQAELAEAEVFTLNILEVQGVLYHLSHFLCGGGVGLAFVGLLYGSPKTRPLFDRFHAFKQRLLGR